MELEWLKKRLAALSRPDRINLIERDNHEISLTKQAELEHIPFRSVLPQNHQPENMEIRHAIDGYSPNSRRRMKDELKIISIFVCRDKTRSHMR